MLTQFTKTAHRQADKGEWKNVRKMQDCYIHRKERKCVKLRDKTSPATPTATETRHVQITKQSELFTPSETNSIERNEATWYICERGTTVQIHKCIQGKIMNSQWEKQRHTHTVRERERERPLQSFTLCATKLTLKWRGKSDRTCVADVTIGMNSGPLIV